MALRTIPVALAHAQVVERYAPDAWYISFTNPAGLITQALALHSKLKVMGICDTPIELFHAIARALRLPISDLEFEYAGLNHLGWVRKVSLRGRNITSELLENEQALLSLYPANLFPAELIRGLGVIPTEYLYFYYRRNAAYRNQAQAKATRGEEIERLNEQVLADIASALKNGDPESAISTYVNYLIRRSGSYMKLEASAGSAFGAITPQEDPFRSSTGYHRMVLEVIAALRSDQPRGVVANVRNDGALEDFADDDVVETICDISSHGVKPRRSGHLPESVRGLAISMKAFERTTVRAAVEQSASVARTALLIHPSIGDWDAAVQLQQAFAF